MVARAGIEPATRGFSEALRGAFGASKPKTGHEFPAGRPTGAGSMRVNELGGSRPNRVRTGRRDGPRCA